VQSDVAWVARLAAIARAIRWVGVLLGALMAAAVVAATFAAARLQALTHRQAIAVSTLLGATRRWVARPYVVHGVLQGAAAGLGAAAIVAAALAGLGGILRPTFPAIADLLAVPALPGPGGGRGRSAPRIRGRLARDPRPFVAACRRLSPGRGARSYPTGLVGNFRLALALLIADC
jgi:hypothetical protein